MGLANSLQKTASKLVKKLGAEVTIRSVTHGAYNTSTGTASESISDAVIKGVVEDVNNREVGELIRAGDRRLIIAAKDVTAAPVTSDKVLISNVVHQIVRVRTIEQDNKAITHELILRN